MCDECSACYLVTIITYSSHYTHLSLLLAITCTVSIFGCVGYIQPKYILQLKKAAEQRKREQEIVFERKQKKEIDSEKEQYGEKDAFVTPSYRKVLEERKAEEERLRKEEEREGEHCGCGLQLYRQQ